MERKFGLIQSPMDERDWTYASKAGVMTTEQLPPTLNRPRKPIRDQGREGTCVGFSLIYGKFAQEQFNHPGKGYEFSPRFVYNEARKIDGISTPSTEGTTIKAGLDILRLKGVCLAETLDYIEYDSRNIPSQAYTEALNFKIKGYARVYSLNEIKSALYRRESVTLGVLVTEDFENCEPGGFIPEPGGRILGGHAIDVDDYDDNMVHTYKNGKTYKGFLRVPNSWGTKWGDEGYCWIPYALLNYATDLGMRFVMEIWASVDMVQADPYPNRKPKRVIKMRVGNKTASVNGVPIALDEAPVNVNGRVMVPIRFVAESLDVDVAWHDPTKEVTLTTK